MPWWTGQWSDHFERAAGAYNARPHETVHGAPEDVEKQPATEFRVLQDNADKFQHNKDLTDRRVKAVEDAGAFRAPTNAARSFNPQYGDVQQLGAVDSMTVRSTEGRETLLKLALPAPQGSGNAAGRLTRRGRPAAVRQLDDFLAPPRPRTLDFLGHCAGWGGIPGACSSLFWEKISFEDALQRSVLCKEACSAKERALQRSVLCKGACSAKESALQRSVLCRGECCAEESALQRSVLCKEACSAKKQGFASNSGVLEIHLGYVGSYFKTIKY